MENFEDIVGILFSGGKGSRLFPINEFYQKVMMPIGIYGTPLLEYVIRHLKYHGIKNFIALIGYKGEMVQRYFGDGSRFGVNISYCFDNPNLKGTASALWNAKDMIGDRDMLVYYTDILTSLDVGKFIKDFRSKSWAWGNLWLDQNWDESEKIVEYDSEFVVQGLSSSLNSEEIPVSERLFVNTGISLLSNKVFGLIEELMPKNIGTDIIELDISRDILPRLAEEGRLGGYFSDNWWVDVGSITRLTSLSPQILVRQMAHLSEEVKF
ncbi:MAG: nucleotidyltransferase family protein [Methanobacteriota archaeon]|nr:MAG: nucleotidyltransferase family protein [Euryarchaeota archaeon]